MSQEKRECEVFQYRQVYPHLFLYKELTDREEMHLWVFCIPIIIQPAK